MFTVSTVALLTSLVLATAPPAPRHPSSCVGGTIECIIEGDTLFKIAEANGLDLEQLTSANAQFSSNIDLIYPEDRVCIPTVCNPIRKSAECVGDLLTLVEAGDTLYNLAQSYNLNFTVLIAVNPQLGPDFDLIFPGDEVCRPKSCPSYKAPAEHEVATKYECVETVENTVNANTTVSTSTTAYYDSVPVTREPRHPASCDGDKVEIECVVPGDNLYDMATRNGITLESLKLSNPQFSDNYDLIFPLDHVCISGESYEVRSPAVCDGDLLTRVQFGDTLYQLAKTNDFSLDHLIEVNPQLGPDYDLIFPGDQVCKPKNCPPFEEVAEYEGTKYDVVVDVVDEYTSSNIEDEGYTQSQNLSSSASTSAMIASAVLVIAALMF
jgi:LysM repeat protein